jgi:ATP-dependent helicase/nuclease subunit B
MRGDFGLPQPERHIGLAAHDFVQAAASDNVVITRSAKLEGAPTVPARWLLRIGALLDGAGLSWPSAQKYLAWGEALDDPGHAPRPVEPPRPRPPIAARPRKLSVTEIETWVRDPYAIFAKHILALRPLDAIDADPGAAERGGFIHQALDEFVAETPWPPPGDAAERLLEIGRECFSGTLDRPGVWAFWWPRFERSARWFVEQLRADAEAGAAKPAAVEVWGRRIFEAPGGDFEVFGKADRIDRDAEGGLTIIDYKTGAVPAAKHVADGRAPQLAVEALIAETGGFDGLEAGAVNDLSYWRLGGGEPAGKVIRVGGDVAQVLTDTLQRLESLIAAFDDADTPYRARPRPAWAPAYADYDLLARVDEWSAEDEGDGG